MLCVQFGKGDVHLGPLVAGLSWDKIRTVEKSVNFWCSHSDNMHIRRIAELRTPRMPGAQSLRFKGRESCYFLNALLKVCCVWCESQALVVSLG